MFRARTSPAPPTSWRNLRCVVFNTNLKKEKRIRFITYLYFPYVLFCITYHFSIFIRSAVCIQRGFSQLCAHWITQFAIVARLRQIPSLAQIFSCPARGSPSTYFCGLLALFKPLYECCFICAVISCIFIKF